jgi:ABC-type amino acid transport substrate-binding protein
MAGLSALAGGGAGMAAPPPTLTQGVLRIGTYFVNPPFEYLKEGVGVGFEVDPMNEIARRLALKPLFVDTRWENILQEMAAGRYDCMVRSLHDEDAEPHRERRADAGEGACGTEDRVGRRAGGDHGLRRRGRDAEKSEIGSVKVYPFDRIGEATADLEAGRSTAVMKVAPVAAWFVRQRPGLRVVAQVPDGPQPLGIGVGKNARALLAAIDRTLAAMRRDGTTARLERKWGVR